MKGALQLVQLDEKGLAMSCRIAKLVESKSTTSPLHQVLTVFMKVVKFPLMSVWVWVLLKDPMVLMTLVRLLRASMADPEAMESTILPFPKGMHTFS